MTQRINRRHFNSKASLVLPGAALLACGITVSDLQGGEQQGIASIFNRTRIAWARSTGGKLSDRLLQIGNGDSPGPSTRRSPYQ